MVQGSRYNMIKRFADTSLYAYNIYKNIYIYLHSHISYRDNHKGWDLTEDYIEFYQFFSYSDSSL